MNQDYIHYTPTYIPVSIAHFVTQLTWFFYSSAQILHVQWPSLSPHRPRTEHPVVMSTYMTYLHSSYTFRFRDRSKVWVMSGFTNVRQLSSLLNKQIPWSDSDNHQAVRAMTRHKKPEENTAQDLAGALWMMILVASLKEGTTRGDGKVKCRLDLAGQGNCPLGMLWSSKPKGENDTWSRYVSSGRWV